MFFPAAHAACLPLWLSTPTDRKPALAACSCADSGDAAALKAEREKLAKELADTKRKFVLVSKKKQAEFAAK